MRGSMIKHVLTVCKVSGVSFAGSRCGVSLSVITPPKPRKPGYLSVSVPQSQDDGQETLTPIDWASVHELGVDWGRG